MERQSFDTLDIDDLEEVEGDETVGGDQSGPRRLPVAPRGLWSDAPPAARAEPVKLPAPPPLPRAVQPTALTEPGELPEPLSSALEAQPVVDSSDRLDFDGLVDDLSSRPAPKPPSAEWELPPALPRPAGVPVLDAPARSRRGTIALAIVGAVALAYGLGVGTTWLLEGPAPTVAAPLVHPPSAPEPGDAPPAVAEEAFAVEEVAAEAVEEVAVEEVAAPEIVETTAPPVAREAAPIRARAPVAEAQPARAEAQPARAEVRDETPVAEPTVAPRADLPESPAREDVVAAMAALAGDVQACASETDRGQLARVRFSFSSEGRPVHTAVSGVSGPSASCIARAARTARVPAFSRDRFVIEYPFQL